MKILINSDGYVDLNVPINIGDDQKEKFVSFMKSLFPDIEVEHKNEPLKNIGERESTPKRWTLEEYVLLLGPYDDIDELSKKMGRTLMSVQMKRGHFVSDFMVWALKKGYAYSPRNVNKEVVERFIKEEGLEK